jgi:hypothetical protein
MSRKLAIILAMLPLAACSSHDDRSASLGHTLTMVDKENVRYGTVEMDPMGGGRVFDAQGRLLGTIVPANTEHP